MFRTNKNRSKLSSIKFLILFSAFLISCVFLRVFNLSASEKFLSAVEQTDNSIDDVVTAGIVDNLPYLTCGESDINEDSQHKEILLLHGAAFKKENWKESGILESLCLLGTPKDEAGLTVTAVDLSTDSDDIGLNDAFEGLKRERILTGKPVVLVTPSASGKTALSLAHSYKSTEVQDRKHEYLEKIVKAWVPVASKGALDPQKADDLTVFKSSNIPVLAINGDEDDGGKKVTELLVDLSGARGVQLKGGHPCYLDSPDKFVETLLEFTNQVYKS